MFSIFGVIQVSIFFFFFIIERKKKATHYIYQKYWLLIWGCVVAFSLVWFYILYHLWSLEGIGITLELSVFYQIAIFYLVYSFGNYWLHRFKHSNKYLWKIHALHHAPRHMDSLVTFFRHPLEYILNSIYLILLGKVVFDIEFIILCGALLIEAGFELFHHSNIRIPKKYHWIGRFIQLPEMHLIHHERNIHQHNYAPILWDWVFGSMRLPKCRSIKLGMSRELNKIITMTNQ